MYSQIRGEIVKISSNFLVLECQGFGMKIFTNPQTLAELRIGIQTLIYTSLVVREDSLTLYGFLAESERDLFELVQNAQGVGPKVALAITSVFSAPDFVSVIRAEQVSALTKVPGIGAKGAKKIILELKDKVNHLVSGDAELIEVSDSIAEAWRNDVSAGLESLGWSTKDAKLACDKIAPLVAEKPNIEISVLMRAALQTLAKA